MASKNPAEQSYELLAKDQPTVEEFKTLLQYVSYGVLAKRYLCTGLPFVFKDQPHKYLAFREAVGRLFSVPPQNIAIMGSARFGFSTNPGKHEDGDPKDLDDRSDMDLVVISESRFTDELESFAEFVFASLRNEKELKTDLKKGDETISLSKRTLQTIRNRAKALALGYVNPSDLPDNTPEKQRFYDLLREAGTQLVGTSPPGPINRVSARIYRDWDAAERIYEYSFRKLADAWKLPAREDAPDDLEPPSKV